MTILLAAAAIALLGAAGLVLDLGRFYVVKAELQNFADGAAVSAVHLLDGTTAGFVDARSAAQSDPNRWRFGTEVVPSIEVGFSQSADGPFEANPAAATDFRFVRVVARADPANYFLRIFPFVGATQTVRAGSVGGQVRVTGVGDGVLPFSPDAHDPADPTGNYGFLLGRRYTLRWDNRVGGTAPPDSFKTSINGVELVGCDMDMLDPAFQPGETSNSQRGYIDLADLQPLGGGGGSSLIKNLIRSKVSFALKIESYNYWITPEPGDKQVITSTLNERAQGDTDPTTPTYFTFSQAAPGMPPIEVMKTTFRDATTYHVGDPRPPLGNGRRLVTVPINDPASNGLVIGFAGFFLPPEPCAEVRVGNKRYTPCCGEYVGPVTRSGRPAAGSGGGLFEVGLVR